jgi:hypothetical protein
VQIYRYKFCVALIVMTTETMFNEAYKLWICSSCMFLHPALPVRQYFTQNGNQPHPSLRMLWLRNVILSSFKISNSFLLVSWCGVRLSPLGTSATIVAAPHDRWWVWSSRRNEIWQGNRIYSEKTCPSATVSTTNPTWPELGSNPGRRGGKPETNRLSYDAAHQ